MPFPPQGHPQGPPQGHPHGGPPPNVLPNVEGQGDVEMEIEDQETGGHQSPRGDRRGGDDR